MTWLKVGDEFADECSRLSDAAFRTHVEGLSWVMRRENGPFVSAHDVRRFAESPEAMAGLAELCAVGFWERTPGGYLVHHHMEHQPEPDVLSERRRKTAARQRKLRRQRAGVPPEPTSSNGVSNGVTKRVTRDGTGRGGEVNPAGKETTQDRVVEGGAW